MKVILDSCIWSGAINTLIGAGHDCKWVGNFLNDPGDEAIMRLAYQEKRVIITLDKDFGELAIFRSVSHHGIIRLVNFSAMEQGKIALDILNRYSDDVSNGAIITVDKSKVRIRLK